MNKRLVELARMAQRRDRAAPPVVVLQGMPGTGKTFAARAVMRWARRTSPAMFPAYIQSFRVGDRENSMLALFADEASYDERGDTARKRIGNMIDADLLIIDDLGNERNPPATFEAGLASLLDQRKEKKRPTWIITNETRDDLLGKYGARNFSRIVNAAEVVKITGRDRRLHV